MRIKASFARIGSVGIPSRVESRQPCLGLLSKCRDHPNLRRALCPKAVLAISFTDMSALGATII
jgi:hypothetical protein